MSSIRKYIDLVETASSEPVAEARHAAQKAKQFDNEKWVRAALMDAGIKADVKYGKIFVDNESDMVRAKAVLNAKPSLQILPIAVKPYHH